MKQKIIEWLKRYAPANILSTCVILSIVLISSHFGINPIVSAYLATIIDNIVYYGFIAIRDMAHTQAKLAKHGEVYTAFSFFKDVRNLVFEFGPAELLDFLVFKPFFIYSAPIWVGNQIWGTILGKYMADFTFYVPTIVAYEIRKKYFD